MSELHAVASPFGTHVEKIDGNLYRIVRKDEKSGVTAQDVIESAMKLVDSASEKKTDGINTSGIEPVGHRLLVLPDEIEETSKGGIVMVTKSTQAREEMAQIEGVAVAIGAECWPQGESSIPDRQPWCKVGDRVIFAKYAGLIYDAKTTLDGKTYRIINDLDVVAVIHKRKEADNG